MKAFKFIKKIINEFPGLLLINTLLLIVLSLLNIVSLMSISPLVDFIIHPDQQGISPMTQKAIGILTFFGLPINLMSWLIIFFIFITLSGIFQVLVRYSILKTKYEVYRALILGTFKDFFEARWAFFSSSRQGILMNTFTREAAIVGDAFGSMATFFSEIMQFFFYLAVPFYISPQVTVLSILVSIVLAVPFILLGKRSYDFGIQNTNTANTLLALLQENLSMAKIVLGFGNQQRSREDLSRAYNDHLRVTLKSQILNMAIPTLYRPCAVLIVIVALIAARWHQVPLSELTVLVLGLFQAGVAVGSITSQKNSLDNFFPSYEQIERLRAEARQMRQVTGTKSFEGFKDKIVIDNIIFAYPGRPSVINGLSLNIEKGKMFAIVGKSGSGKSTLIDIIMGFYETVSGKVLVDGTSLSEFDIISYRHKIGYVPQESVLFNLTIRENLLWSNPSADEHEIKRACELAYADEFICHLPQGYDTHVGDRGVRLSGGQIQRIALARALLRRPELLILDEATSALDTQSERLIQKAVENVAKETTVIVVAHRLSTIKNADCIYVLDQGKVVESGHYSKLIENSGQFKSMVQLQELEAV